MKRVTNPPLSPGRIDRRVSIPIERPSSRSSRGRRGLVILVVLGMLALFSVLTVAYVVFSTRALESSTSLASRDYRQPRHDELLDRAMLDILRGPQALNSPIRDQSILEDRDGRDSIRGTALNPNLQPTADRGAIRLRGHFVKLPINFGGTAIADNEGMSPGPGTTDTRVYDDALSGRTLTFLEGPLRNQSMKIHRWIGFRDPTDVDEFPFRNSAMIELPDDLSVVELGTGVRRRWSDLINPIVGQPRAAFDPSTAGSAANLQWASRNIRALFYGPGGDGGWGIAGTDDDGIGGVDNESEAGFPGTDDVPFAFLINGVLFNGYGEGMGARNITQTLNIPASGSAGPVAVPAPFLPNRSRDAAVRNGAQDEGFDVGDYRDTFLARRQNGLPIPSYHRPELINYLVNYLGTNSVDLSGLNQDQLRQLVEQIRRATLRPLPFDENQHLTAFGANDPTQRFQTFDGGNRSPGLGVVRQLILDEGNPLDRQRLSAMLRALVRGPFDVDNDGDGIPDSVWLDLLLPTIVSGEGKILQPMIAPMVEDMDGLINVNAHGQWTHIDNGATYSYTAPAAITGPWPAGQFNTPIAELFRGRGYGPAEIVIPDTLLPQNILSSMFQRRYVGPLAYNPAYPAPFQRWDSYMPGINGDDGLDNVAHSARAGLHSFVKTATGPNIEGYPLDVLGRGTLTQDLYGQLFSTGAGQPLNRFGDARDTPFQNPEVQNDPYETDVAGVLGDDNVFDAAEFEKLIRIRSFDRSASADDLMTILSASLSATPENAQMLTFRSRSFANPVAQVGNSELDRTLATGYNTSDPVRLLDVLLSKANHLTLAQRQNFVRQMIAPELRLGNRFNINRPFGNGIDDDGNFVIDEPAEGLAGLDAEVLHGRRLYMRHLYLLMSLLLQEDYLGQPLRVGDIDPTVQTTTVGAPPMARAYEQQRLAQWVANVVDYRDRDAIATRFVYDSRPLDNDTWDDGFNGTIYSFTNPATAEVWGCEAPEAALSESLSLHDLRVKDTDDDASGEDKSSTTPDTNSDTLRRPEGSTFIEIRSLRPRNVSESATSANHLSVPAELYNVDPADGQAYLDLTRREPISGFPVWRIVMSDIHAAPEAVLGTDTVSLEGKRNRWTDLASFQANGPDARQSVVPLNGTVTDPPTAGLIPDRFIYFQNPSEGMTNRAAVRTQMQNVLQQEFGVAAAAMVGDEEGRLFHSFSATSARLRAGDYLVLAPRVITHLGNQRAALPTQPSPQRFEMETLGGNAFPSLVHYNTSGERVTPRMESSTVTSPYLTNPLVVPSVQPSRCIEVATWVPQSWATLNNAIADEEARVGLNISEPNAFYLSGQYYPQPTQRLMGSMNPAFPYVDSYRDLSTNVGVPIDTPVDLEPNTPIRQIMDGLNTTAVAAGDPDTEYEVPVGTVPNVRTAYLQRLADPTIAFNNDRGSVAYNPYITVDALPMDLTVFSGEEDPTPASGLDMTAFFQETGGGGGNYFAGTRQRTGEDARGNVVPQARALHSFATNDPNRPGNFGADPNIYSMQWYNQNQAGVDTSISATWYFGVDYGTPTLATVPPTPVAVPRNTLGFRNFSFGTTYPFADPTAPPNGPFAGSSSELVMAQHPWLNRDFASPYELMMVPMCGPSRLFQDFSFANTVNNAYDSTATIDAGSNPTRDRSRLPFGHLLNFFEGVQTGTTTLNLGDSPHYYRLFDFVETPAPYRGERRRLATYPATGMFPAVNTAELVLSNTTTWDRSLDAMFGMQVPGIGAFSVFAGNSYGNVDLGVRNGRINLNTMPDLPQVYLGLMFNHLTSTERGNIATGALPALLNARQGATLQASTGDQVVDASGAFTAGPYVLAEDGMVNSDFPTSVAAPFRGANTANLAPLLGGTNDDRMRRWGVRGTLMRNQFDTTAGANGSDSTLPSPMYVRGDTNTTGTLTRNGVTSPFNRYETLMRMPNLTTNQSNVFVVRLTIGYFEVDPISGNVGREYGTETGRRQRFQAMYIIDRTIPCAFEPGQDHNVRNTILFQQVYAR
jgi:hypothetical protein